MVINITYFNSIRVEHVPNEIKKFIKKQKYNIYRIQAYDSIIWWYFYIGSIDSMLKGKRLLG